MKARNQIAALWANLAAYLGHACHAFSILMRGASLATPLKPALGALDRKWRRRTTRHFCSFRDRVRFALLLV